MRISLIVVALVALPVLSACGGNSEAAKPSVTQQELAQSLQEGLRDSKLAECAAKIYIDQGISQEGLRVMVKRDTKAQAIDPESLGMGKEDAEKARAATNRILTECIKS